MTVRRAAVIECDPDRGPLSVGTRAVAAPLLEEVPKLLDRGRSADPLVREVLEIRERVRGHGPLFHVLTNLAKADELVSVEADRLLRARGLEGRDRQRAQAERDQAYLEGLRNAALFLDELLDEALAAVRARRAALASGAGPPSRGVMDGHSGRE